MDPKIAAWYALGTLILSALLSALRPDNKFLPFALSTRSRVLLTFALGAVMTGVQTYFKQPVSDAALTALGVMGTGFALAGAPRATTAILLLCLATSVSACSFFTPKRVEAIAKVTECVLAHRMLKPADIAVECAVDKTQEVVDIIAGAEKREAVARSLGETEGRQLGAAACKR